MNRLHPIAPFLLLLNLGFLPAGAGEPTVETDYQAIAEKVTRLGLTEDYAYSVLARLTRIGPRLTGSPGAAAAVELMRQEMLDLGLDNVHLEPTVVGRWVRGEVEEGRLVSSLLGTIPLSICALGGSIATPEDGIQARVLEVKSFQELREIGDKARGKIIFFNRPMDPTRVDTFRAYGEAADQRVNGAVAAAKAGGVAALVRSLALAENDFPHTGLLKYDENTARLPSAAISTRGANILSRALRVDPELVVYLKTSSATLAPVTSYNVIGDLKGTDRPDEIIL